MYKNSFNSVAHKTNHMIKTWAEELNRHSSNKDIQIVSRYMKRRSTSLILRNENQNRNEISPHTYKNGNYQKDKR